MSRLARELKRLRLERRRLQIQRDEHHASLLRMYRASIEYSPDTIRLIDARLLQLDGDIRQATRDLLAQSGSEPVPERLVNDLMQNAHVSDPWISRNFPPRGESVLRVRTYHGDERAKLKLELDSNINNCLVGSVPPAFLPPYRAI